MISKPKQCLHLKMNIQMYLCQIIELSNEHCDDLLRKNDDKSATQSSCQIFLIFPRFYFDHNFWQIKSLFQYEIDIYMFEKYNPNHFL